MCRFLAYRGEPVILDKLLYQPENSLINQSFDSKEMKEPLNGDGFGIGWYIPDIEETPAVFTSIQPAWHNQNLKNLAPKVISGTLFAHVRAATLGQISETNCHPFQYGKYLFMHNGSLGEFPSIKRGIRKRLSDEIYNSISGETDSEHLFALFLEYLHHSDDMLCMETALSNAISEIENIQRNFDIIKPNFINAVVTDGEKMTAIRYVSEPENFVPHTLYYSTGSHFDCIDGKCRMEQGGSQNNAVLIVSEKLTEEKNEWHKIPPNSSISVDADLEITHRSVRN